MLMNWPSFNAAPRIWVNFDTSRLMFPSVSMSDGGAVLSLEVVERRMSSEAAPYPREAARPDTAGTKYLESIHGHNTYLHSGKAGQYERKGLWRIVNFGFAEVRRTEPSRPASAQRLQGECHDVLLLLQVHSS